MFAMMNIGSAGQWAKALYFDIVAVKSGRYANHSTVGGAIDRNMQWHTGMRLKSSGSLSSSKAFP